MVGVKKHAQESQTQSKPEMIHGHLWGNVSILIGTAEKLACLPLSTRIHDGLQAMAEWGGVDISSESHIVQIMHNTCEAATAFARHAYLLADRYFLTIPALRILNEYNRTSPSRIDLITKAKKNITAYEEPKRTNHKRGRPRLKGNRIKLNSFFERGFSPVDAKVRFIVYWKGENDEEETPVILADLKLAKKPKF